MRHLCRRFCISTKRTMRACCSDAGDFQRPSREISLGIDHIPLIADTTKPVSNHKNRLKRYVRDGFCMQKVRRIETWFDHYCAFCDPTKLLRYVISPASLAVPRWRPFCSCRRRGCRYPAWWRADCGRGYPPLSPHQSRPRSSDWRRCAGGSGRSAPAVGRSS